MAKTRTEKDSMGEVQVPEEALWGAQTQRAADNFPISGWRLPRAFIRALGLVKACCAQVNQELGELAPDIAQAIFDAAMKVSSGEVDDHFPIDVFQTGSGTSTNMNANEVISRLASQALGRLVHPNDHVNRGQSSNDTIPTALHVSAALELQEQLFPMLENLSQGLGEKAKMLEKNAKTGRTHLMDAMPVTFGQEISGWHQQIEDSRSRIADTLKRLARLAQGGTAVGTGVNAHPEFGPRVAQALAQHTGIPFSPAPNFFSALSSQETALELSGNLRTLATALVKIGNDLRWMNSGPLAGLGEISLPALQPGSSIMPGKVNPVIPEAVIQVAAQVAGMDAAIGFLCRESFFQLNTGLPAIAYNLLQMIRLLASSAKVLLDKAISGFTVNEARVREALSRNPILVTALNSVIGYEKGAEIAKKAYATGAAIIDVAKEMTDIPEEELLRLLDPLALTGKHDAG